ncbi:MAG: Trp family transcriptional regulator [bacterium]|nr:Trp family transcriptional regulator [bacterium]
MKLPNFPVIRRKPYKDRWDKTHWAVILKHLSTLKSEKELEKFFEIFLPEGDRLKLIQRVVACKRLNEGYKHRDISTELGMSTQTISSVKKAAEESHYLPYNERFKEIIEKRREKTLRYLDKKAEKSVPKRYRRTKYGRISF